MGKPDPNTVGIHALMIALVLSRKTLTMADKVKRIFMLICYEVAPGKIQKSEFQYVFHLLYNWIKVCTCFDMKTSAIQKSVEARLFIENIEIVGLDESIVWVAKEQELEQIF